MSKKPDNVVDPENFSLGLGGPLYQLYLFMHLLKKPLLLCQRRVIFVSLLAWFPLLLLAILGGVAFGGVRIPFIFDIDVHVRFLLSLSLLIYAEVIAHDRIHIIVEQFLKCNIIESFDKPKFNRILTSAIRLRDSVLVEVILIILVYTVGHLISIKYLPLGVTNWYTARLDDIIQLTPAGYWYVYISLPLFQFILLRWYFRMIVWYRFLWQVSRLPLRLNSLHPDRAGGLGFIAYSIYAFEPFLLAHSMLLAGVIFNRIWNTGAILSDFKTEIFGILTFIIILPLIPMLFFIISMIKEKRLGTLKYDIVANRYVDEFKQKWINTKSKNNELLLGTPDIQAISDLSNSFEVSNRMRITPFDRYNIIALVIVTALPLFPLIFTIIPLEKIISQTFNLLF